MPNTNVFTGADGSITLSTPEGAEGALAQATIDTYATVSVGRVQDVRFAVHSEIKPFHEIGQRYATELRAGNIDITGTIGRAWINGAMLSLLLGEAASARPGASWAQPAFNLTLLMTNAANPDSRSTVTLHQIKIENWSGHVPEDDFTMEELSFKALYLTVQDEG
jgi:hypothetical protein